MRAGLRAPAFLITLFYVTKRMRSVDYTSDGVSQYNSVSINGGTYSSLVCWEERYQCAERPANKAILKIGNLTDCKHHDRENSHQNISTHYGTPTHVLK